MFQRNRGSMIGKPAGYADDSGIRSHVDPSAGPEQPTQTAPTMIRQDNTPGGHFLVGPPTSVGFYWWKAIGARKIAGPDEVISHPLLGLVCLNRSGANPVHFKPVTDFIREWAGPLPRPPED